MGKFEELTKQLEQDERLDQGQQPEFVETQTEEQKPKGPAYLSKRPTAMLTVAGLAARLFVHPSRIEALIEEGQLPVWKAPDGELILDANSVGQVEALLKRQRAAESKAQIAKAGRTERERRERAKQARDASSKPARTEKRRLFDRLKWIIARVREGVFFGVEWDEQSLERDYAMRNFGGHGMQRLQDVLAGRGDPGFSRQPGGGPERARNRLRSLIGGLGR